MKKNTLPFSCSAILLLSLLVHTGVWAKPAVQEMSLAMALKQLALHYKVNFLYEDQTVAGKTVADGINLFQEKEVTKILNRILPPLGLSWFNIDNKNYAVCPTKHKAQTSPDSSARASLNQGPDTLPEGTVTGYLLDENRHAQSFASVQLCLPVDSAVAGMVLSDTSGRYRFTRIRPGNYRVKASLLGYQTTWSPVITLTGNAGLTVDALLMKLSSQTLSEVRITGSRPLVERKNDRFILNVENSPMSAGSSLQLLRSAPFVNISPDNTVTLQGKRTMILIDGRPVPGAALEDILQTLPAGNISSVELITDPSSKYDASFGAVISIITKKNRLEGLTGNLRSEYSQGDYARANTNGRFTYRHNNLTLFGAAGYNRFNMQQHDDTHRTLAGAGATDQIHEQITRTFYQNLPNFQAGGNVDIPNGQSFGVLIAGRMNSTNGSFNSSDGFNQVHGPLDSLLNTRSPFHNAQHSFDYNVNYHLLADSGKSELNILSTLSPIKRAITQNFTSALLNPTGNTLKTPSPYQSATTSRFLIFIAQADFSRALSKQWKLETGVKYQSTDSRQVIDFKTDTAGVLHPSPQNSSNNHLTEDILGIYSTLSKKWKSDQLRLGLRMENTNDRYAGFYNLHQLDWFPSALYLHDFNGQDNISLSYRRTVDRAPYTELVPYRLIINQYNINLGNPSLKPQFNNYFSLNTRIRDLNISVNYTLTRGFIAQTPESEDFVNKVTYIFYQNLDHASDLFIDVYYPIKITRWWNTQNSVTLFGYASATGQVLGQPFSVAAARYGVRSNQTFKLAGPVKLEMDGYYNSSRSDGLTKFGGYGNLDAALLVELLQGKGQLRIGADDILKKNVYHTAQDFGVYSTFRNRYQDSQRGSISFTYNFGQTRIKAPTKKLGNEDAIDRTR